MPFISEGEAVDERFAHGHRRRRKGRAADGYIKHFFVKQHSIQPLKLIFQVTAVFTQTVQHIFWISHATRSYSGLPR